MLTLVLVALAVDPTYPSATTEGVHIAGAYYVARGGTSWSYATAGKTPGKARVSVTEIINWQAHFRIDWGKRSGGGSWRVKEGAWVERSSRSAEEIVVLPAALAVGTRWAGPSSVERAGTDVSDFEVLALDATAEFDGKSYERCLAVLETGRVGPSSPVTHFYAPNIGKVAVRGPDNEWILRLAEYLPGRGSSGE